MCYAYVLICGKEGDACKFGTLIGKFGNLRNLWVVFKNQDDRLYDSPLLKNPWNQLNYFVNLKCKPANGF